jgi:hypothetical protein
VIATVPAAETPVNLAFSIGSAEEERGAGPNDL